MIWSMPLLRQKMNVSSVTLELMREARCVRLPIWVKKEVQVPFLNNWRDNSSLEFDHEIPSMLLSKKLRNG